MSGDYTRWSYRPQQRYSGVLMQQGRVQLDADWNELVQIFKRRWELLSMDCVPVGYAAITPQAFRVTPVPGSPLDLALGVGRMYVHGLLAEIFDEESYSYLNQPYYPDPPALPTGSRTLIYLDVWEREVTWVEDRELLEKALQGPDTTTRTQTVWQVKHTTGHCGTDLSALFPPSAGRLSSRAQVPPLPDGPCIVSPAGGYRGVENRLYRVQVHDPGVAGDLSSVRFKWSRDNASIVSPVQDIATAGTQTELVVALIGRDQVLRFRIDDWVELLDDHRELMGQPGEMAQVVAVDEANRRVTLDRVMPGDFDATDPARHTRLIRWDQSQLVDQDGLMQASSSWIPLEDGVEVQLSLAPATGSFHVGDYWAFAARTADGSVKELLEKPPRGIVHRYCHLAVLTGVDPAGGAAQAVDCRSPWCRKGDDDSSDEPPPTPAGRMCCVVVSPGQSIQAAIDHLPAGGGCVCLRPGTHTVTAPIQISSSNVVLQGASLGARVVRTNGARALSVGNGALNVLVDGIAFESLRPPTSDEAEIILLESSRNVTVAHCSIAAGATPVPGAPVSSSVVAISVLKCSWVQIQGNQLSSVGTGVLGNESGWVHVADNRIAFEATDVASSASLGVGTGETALGPWLVERNRIENCLVGIWIGREAVGSLVVHNSIERSPAVQPGEGSSTAFAIDIGAAHCRAQENLIHLAAPEHAGIHASGSYCWINHNRVSSEAGFDAADPSTAAPWGILLDAFAGTTESTERCVVECNSLIGRMDAIRVRGASPAQGLADIVIRGNRIEPLQQRVLYSPQVAIRLENTTGAVVAHNLIRDALLGISSDNGARLQVHANDIENVAGPGIEASRGLEMASLAHNRLAWCAYRTTDENVVPAVVVQMTDGHVRIESCEVIDAGLSRDQGSEAKRVYGIRVSAFSCQIDGNRVAYSDLSNQTQVDRPALVVSSLLDSRGGHAAVLDNCFSGCSEAPLVEVRSISGSRFDRVTFSNNHCEHRWTGDATTDPDQRATVSLTCRHLIVMANHIQAQPSFLASINFTGLKQVALMGNVTTGPFINLGSSVPTPPQHYNVQV